MSPPATDGARVQRRREGQPPSVEAAAAGAQADAVLPVPPPATATASAAGAAGRCGGGFGYGNSRGRQPYGGVLVGERPGRGAGRDCCPDEGVRGLPQGEIALPGSMALRYVRVRAVDGFVWQDSMN